MKIIALVFFITYVFVFLVQPSLFGKERDPYSFRNWILNLIINIPLIYLLYQVAFNNVLK